MAKHLSGEVCIRVLCNHFGFYIARQKGSHVVLRKNGFGTVIPLHKELKQGTLKGVLKQARVNEEDFKKFL